MVKINDILSVVKNNNKIKTALKGDIAIVNEFRSIAYPCATISIQEYTLLFPQTVKYRIFLFTKVTASTLEIEDAIEKMAEIASEIVEELRVTYGCQMDNIACLPIANQTTDIIAGCYFDIIFTFDEC